MITQRWSPSGPLANERGAALFAAVLAMLILSTMMVAFAVVARDEVVISQNAREAATAEFAAEAGANFARFILSRRLTTDVNAEVAKLDRPTMKNLLATTYNTHTGSALFLVQRALAQSDGYGNFQICSSCPEPIHTPGGEIPDNQQVVLTLNGTNPTYTARIIVSVPNGPSGLPIIIGGGRAAEMIYMWRVESTGRTGRSTQMISHDSVIASAPQGTFKIYLNSGFVQYAHFIDQMDSTQAWISFRHVYTGPVHTNTRFNILGNPTGPTFRSEATQTLNDIRFNNNGSTVTQPRDSTANDWPVLGPAPGVLCKSVDCTGLTRNHDYDPVAPGIQPIPFPNAGDPTTLTDRDAEIQKALGQDPDPVGGTPVAVIPVGCGNTTGTGWTTNCGGPFAPGSNPANGLVRVLVANSLGWGDGTIRGGIYVNGPNPGDVRDIMFGSITAGPQVGQRIIICTQNSPAQANGGCTGAGGGDWQRRTVIQEIRPPVPGPGGTTIVRRECWGRPAPAPQPNCTDGVGSQWMLDPFILTPGVQQQVLTGTFSPDTQTDHGVIYVRGSIGRVDTEFGLRQCPNIVGGAGGTFPTYCPGTTAAIYNKPADAFDGARWTVAANGNIFLTGHLILQRDPRSNDVPEPVFTTPIPGLNDDLDVQNVFGVVAWGGGVRMSRWLSPANLNTRYLGIANADLYLQGLFMAPNIDGGNEPEGQISFDDPNGAYRGRARLLGGVIQQTLGTLGSPGTPGTGYARDWVYDERFRHRAMSPPLFPGFPRFSSTGGPGKDDFTFRSGSF
jgi:hypothetical protein